MEARTSTPQRLPKSENPPEYEKIVSNSNFNDNCSVYSDVSRATSKASRSRRQKSSRDKSVSIQAPSKSTRYTEGVMKVDIPEDDSRRWPGETETFATSECTRISNEDLGKFHADLAARRVRMRKYLDPAHLSVVCVQSMAYLTPVIFLILPKFVAEESLTDSGCDIGCEGGIISIAVRLGILLIASICIFWKKNRAKLPQINLYRATVNGLTFGITAVYWIFFAYKVIHWDDYSYAPIVSYTSNYVNILLFLHYLTCCLMYFKSKQQIYLLEVVRTTDGAHKFYNCGELSVQEAAAYILEKYYVDFHLYNPAAQKTSKSSRIKNLTNFKMYDIDGAGDGESKAEKSRAILAAAARRRDAGHNEKYYEEVERERRIRKRKARLTEAAEDAFSHVRRQLISDSQMPGNEAMDPRQTAETIFPSIARSMQKYLRTTRQNQHYTIEDIIDHLAFCIRHDMSSKSFLQRYVTQRPSAAYPGQLMTSVDWSVNCDEPLISLLRPGVVFSLNQSEYSLVVTCRTAPKVELREEFIDPASHRFVIRMDSSETSV